MKRLAFYGSLRKGEYNHRKDLGDPLITGTIDNAALYSLGAYPAIVEVKNGGSVVVEVYEIPDDDAKWIERMELGAGYVRRPVTVHYSDIEGALTILQEIEADAYFFPEVKDWFGPQIVNGDWTTRTKETFDETD